MKYLRLKRITKVKTFPKLCLELMYDYTHFLYNHKTSFTDFKIIKENDNQHIYYYETKVFNWLPWSPIRRFISIKKLLPEKRMFYQIYLDLKSKHRFLLKCSMENNADDCEITNEVIIPISNFLYLFKQPICWIINKKMDIMWKEDREIMATQYLHPEHENIQCVPKYYNLENIFQNTYNKDFEKYFGEEKEIDYLFSKEK